MARFILDYDTQLKQSTIELITDNCVASMLSPYETSAQFCLIDVIDFLDNEKMINSELSTDGVSYDNADIENDLKHLRKIHTESVNYIEICF